MQEIGKSYTSLEQAIYQAYMAKHRQKALIFDTNNEYGQYEINGKVHNIRLLGHHEIIAYSNSKVPEVRRIAPFINGMPMGPDETEALLIKVIKEFRGGTLIIEDVNMIFGDSLPVSVSGLLCNVRHRNAFVVLHLQSVGRVLPKMRQNCKVFRYHYQLDSIEESKDKLHDDYEIFKIAEKMVNRQFENGNQRFKLYIYRVIKKIKGKYSPRMLSEAIQEYLSENMRILKPIIEKRNATTGQKMYTYEQAMSMKTVELFRKYYGN